MWSKWLSVFFLFFVPCVGQAQNRFPESENPLLGTFFSFPIRATSELGFGLKGQDFNILMRAETLVGFGAELEWTRKLPSTQVSGSTVSDNFFFLLPLNWNSLEGWNGGIVSGLGLQSGNSSFLMGLEGGFLLGNLRLQAQSLILPSTSATIGAGLRNRLQLEYFFAQSSLVLGYVALRVEENIRRSSPDLNLNSTISTTSTPSYAFVTGMRF